MSRLSLAVCLLLWTGWTQAASPPPAAARKEWTIPASRARQGLRVAYQRSEAGATLTWSQSGSPPGAPGTLDLPAEVAASAPESRLVRLLGGETVLVSSFADPGDPARSYAVVLLGPAKDATDGLERALLLKGFVAKEPHAERPSLSIAPGTGGARLLLTSPTQGEVACGPLQPSRARLLDGARGEFVPVALPALGAQARKTAKKVHAVSAADAAPRVELFLGLVPDPELVPGPEDAEPVDAEALVDGRRDLPPAPHARALLHWPAGLTRQSVVVHLAPAAGSEPGSAGELWLVGERGVVQVELAQGAVELAQSAADPRVEVPLPEELREGCLAVVTGAKSRVVELGGVVEGALPSAERAVATLGDAQTELTARILVGAGPALVLAQVPTFRAASVRGRAALESAFRTLAPEQAGPAWAGVVAVGDAAEVQRARARLRELPDRGTAALLGALGKARPAEQSKLVRVLGEGAPDAAVDALGTLLVQSSKAQRQELRLAVAELGRSEAFLGAIERALAEGKLATPARIEIFRALGRRVTRLGEPARAEVYRLFARPTFTEAYLLSGVALELARREPAAQRQLAIWLEGAVPAKTPSERAALRAQILGLGLEREVLGLWLARAARARLHDDSMRVRRAAALYLAVSPDPAAGKELGSVLAQDEWPVVRQASGAALGALRKQQGHAEGIDPGLARALAKDESSLVRAEIARALGHFPTETSLAGLRRALEKDPDASVRAEAARSLGLVCDAKSVDALTAAARGLLAGVKDDAEVRLGLYAAGALARIAPPDLDARLRPLRAKSAAGGLSARIDAEVERSFHGCAAGARR